MDRLETFLSREQIALRIRELGKDIGAAYGGRPITAICVLKGSTLFTADLVREVAQDVNLEFLGVSSYHGTESTGAVRITHDLHGSIEGKDVLLIEDIVDTGLTLSYLQKVLEVRGPRSLKTAVLLDKPSRRRVQAQVDFVGFTIPDAFVVGYGLDLDQRFRNLPYIAVYHPETEAG